MSVFVFFLIGHVGNEENDSKKEMIKWISEER